MSNLQRVSKNEPCLICSKDSWCMFDEKSSLCMRIPSHRPLTMKGGETGWFHDNGAPRKEWKPQPKKEEVKIDAAKMMNEWRKFTLRTWLGNMADSIGVDIRSVMRLNPAWAFDWNAWAWPMTDGLGRVCGIRLRTDSGRKFAVTGSRQGLFIPSGEVSHRVYFCEGPTDAAALLSLGVYSIGRPSASGGILDIKQTIDRLRIREVVIIADNDDDKYTPDGRKFNPGFDGAASLQNHIQVPSCVISLPTKDAREFVKDGGTKETLEYFVKSAVWTTGLS